VANRWYSWTARGSRAIRPGCALFRGAADARLPDRCPRRARGPHPGELDRLAGRLARQGDVEAQTAVAWSAAGLDGAADPGVVGPVGPPGAAPAAGQLDADLGDFLVGQGVDFGKEPTGDAP
jgi:hypothetical protein